MSVIKADKKKLRSVAKARRADAFLRHGTAASDAIAAHGLGFLGPQVVGAVSGFSAIGDEINSEALMGRLLGEGFSLALPAMQGKGQALVFRAWTPGDEMAAALWGIAEPLPTRATVVPDILLVPLLAFDDEGYRLGYGGGFYDRTLDELRSIKPIVAVGLAYDEQRLDGVPHLDYDQPLDWVLTPSGPRKCSKL